MDANALAVVVRQVIGPILIGVVVHASLFGVVVCQYIRYFTLDFKDSRLLLWVSRFLVVSPLTLMQCHHRLDGLGRPASHHEFCCSLVELRYREFRGSDCAAKHGVELQHGAAFLYIVRTPRRSATDPHPYET